MKATSTKIMNRQLVLFALWSVAATTFAQGLVNFGNTSTQPVTVGAFGNEQLMSGPPGSYYFGLLTNNGGSLYSFAGVYATNGTVRGLFSGGNSVAVAGWQPGDARNVEIAGWSAGLGHDWNPAWLMGVFPPGESFVFGVSGSGFSMASPTSPVWPAADLFFPQNAMGIFGGFNLFPAGIPEPSGLQLWCLIAAVLSMWRPNHPPQYDPTPTRSS